MAFLSKTYWRMLSGFVIIIVVALGLLYLSSLYLNDKTYSVPGDYLAVPEAGT